MKKVKFDEAQDKDLLKDKGIEEKDDDSIDQVQVRIKSFFYRFDNPVALGPSKGPAKSRKASNCHQVPR